MKTFTLSNGMQLPSVGFGTYQAKGEAGEQAILWALEAGYRFFDTASLYGTERILGQVVRKSGIPRDQLILETKLWIDETDDPQAALERSLRRLGTDYVDIYMIHWPRRPGDPDWKEHLAETYQKMEKLVDQGKARALGLSNFLPHHLRVILETSRIRPVADQLELHPGYSQEASTAFCREHGVLPIAWSPFGRGDRNSTVSNRILAEFAEKYGRTPYQINLRFLLQKGILPIPKASSREHILANLDVFDFELSGEDVSMISCMPQNTWLGEHPDFFIPTVKSSAEEQ